jgi:hypothetical protein
MAIAAVLGAVFAVVLVGSGLIVLRASTSSDGVDLRRARLTSVRRDSRQPRRGVGVDPHVKAITLDDFKAEVGRWATRMEVEPAEVHVTVMWRKWASCSPRRRVTFNTELLAQPGELRREAIVHELFHLKVSNHGHSPGRF